LLVTVSKTRRLGRAPTEAEHIAKEDAMRLISLSAVEMHTDPSFEAMSLSDVAPEIYELSPSQYWQLSGADCEGNESCTANMCNPNDCTFNSCNGNMSCAMDYCGTNDCYHELVQYAVLWDGLVRRQLLWNQL
jgi:hypothetical protein